MADIATHEFLSNLKALYPTPTTTSEASQSVTVDDLNPWYVAALATFNGCNRPDAIPKVYEYVMKELGESSSLEEKRRLTTKMREILFRCVLTSGYSKMMNSLVALYDVTPEELRGTTCLRNTKDQLVDLQARGREFFNTLYGETAVSTQAILDKMHPDAGFFAESVAYGYAYPPDEFVSAREMTFLLIATLIAVDTPRQVAWHLASSRRVGASLEETRAVRQIAMEIGSKCGVEWRSGVPDIDA